MRYITIPLLDQTGLDLFESMSDREEASGCVIWSGMKTTNGYGRFRYKRVLYMAHRVSYTQANGDIPEGMVIDHVCRNRACVNPDHLEMVTFTDNVRRGLRGELYPYKDVCSNGHALEGLQQSFHRTQQEVPHLLQRIPARIRP